ncbi:MAG: exo-beta-N-acetylmuramidase NamZ family protein [Inquilinaceae bacterium]
MTGPAVDRLDAHAGLLAGKRLGLVMNHTSVDSGFTPTLVRLRALPGVRVDRLFAPEHGLAGAVPAAGPVDDAIDPDSGLPVTALYGPRRRPEPAHLEGLDAVVFDLQDVGVRAFTYLATLLELCRTGVPVTVLDRPNPLGGRSEGGGVAAGAENFVAPFDVPLRHGLTLGEIARLFAAEHDLPPPVVAPCGGWRRDRGRPDVSAANGSWIAPSPNLPTADAALAYAGTVLIEGTTLSEGRGTTRPFTLVGAPDINGTALAKALVDTGLPGFRPRPATFIPATSKHAGQVCRGVEVHITDQAAYRAVDVGLEILAFMRDHGPPSFATLPFLNALAGGPALRDWCATPGTPPAALREIWAADRTRFADRAAPHLLYGPLP